MLGRVEEDRRWRLCQKQLNSPPRAAKQGYESHFYQLLHCACVVHTFTCDSSVLLSIFQIALNLINVWTKAILPNYNTIVLVINLAHPSLINTLSIPSLPPAFFSYIFLCCITCMSPRCNLKELRWSYTHHKFLLCFSFSKDLFLCLFLLLYFWKLSMLFIFGWWFALFYLWPVAYLKKNLISSYYFLEGLRTTCFLRLFICLFS
jgi:hypothetical protein